MNISRVSKAVATLSGAAAFQTATAIRHQDIDLFLYDTSNASNRMMAKFAVALALRSFTGKLRVHTALRDETLVDDLRNEAKKMRSIDRLLIGDNAVGDNKIAIAHEVDGAISIDVSGWTSRINGVFRQRVPGSAPAAAFATACGVAKVFNHAVLKKEKNFDEQWDFSMLNFSADRADEAVSGGATDIGRIGLLGAGAIGSAVGYVLLQTPWAGTLEIIDDDMFEEPNLETCVSADSDDVLCSLPKAEGLANVFSRHPIKATPVRMRVNRDSTILQERRDAFVCAVDNSATRRILDDVNAQVLLNAGVGGSRDDAGWVLWSRHSNDGLKLSTLYADEPDAQSIATETPVEFREECSRLAYNGVSLALPFAALAAGSLLAASLYQRATCREASISSLQVDVLGKQQRMTARRRVEVS